MTIVTSYTKDGILNLLADVEWNRGPVGDTKDLNDISVRGLYTQDEDAKATAALNYPAQMWGFLQVFPDGDSGGTIQQYMTTDAMYIRKKSDTGVWTEWTRFQGPKGDRGDTGITYRGNYSSTTQYYVGDAVYYNYASYFAIKDVKGSTPSSSNANWAVLAARGATGSPGIVWKGPWSSTVSYAVGDAVFYEGSAYIAKDAGTNVVPTSDATKWDLLASKGDPGPRGLLWRGVWSSAVSYSAQDAVAYGGSSYIAKVTNKNVTPGTDTSKWDIVAEKGSSGATQTPGLTVESIPAGSNLNDYSANGYFVQSSNSNATLELNYPVAQAGLLQVHALGPMVFQQYTVYSTKTANDSAVYTRGRYNGTWGSWYKNIQNNDLIVPPTTASTANSGKVVTLNANGRLMTITTPTFEQEAASKRYVDDNLVSAKKYTDDKIQVVTALPATPDANTLYLIKEA